MGENSGYKHYVAGLVSGVSMVIVGHPFDTVKVKLQKHNTEANGFKYRSGLHCTTRILKTEGVRGLYRGATPSFVGMAFESSILFGIYSQTKQALQGGDHNRKPEPHIIIPSAAFAGSIISFILCPSELVKCRMQIQGTDSLVPTSRKYSGPLNCAIQTVKTEGVSGLFRGGVTTLMREAIGNAVFFSTYEYLRHSMHLRLKDSSIDHTNLIDVGIGIVSGGLSGIAKTLMPSSSLLLKIALESLSIAAPCNKCSFKAAFDIHDGMGRDRVGFIGLYLMMTNEDEEGINVLCTNEGSRASPSPTLFHLFKDKTLQFCPTDIDPKVQHKPNEFWSAVLPLDVAKTIIQTTPDKNLTKNPFKLLKSIYRRSGLRGCYTGLGPTVSRAFPANAAAIVTFEAASKVLGIVRD